MFGQPLNAEYGQPIIGNHSPAITTTATSASFAIPMAAEALSMWVVDWIAYSFDGTPADSNTITVQIGGIVRYQQVPFLPGPQFIAFPGGLHNNAVNEVCLIQLASTAAVSGKLNAGYRRVPFLPDEHAMRSFLHDTGVNTALVGTFAAAANVRHVIDWAHVGYSGSSTAAAGSLFTITKGGTTVFEHDLVENRPYTFNDLGIVGDENSAVVCTLDAGGANVAGKLNIGSR